MPATHLVGRAQLRWQRIPTPVQERFFFRVNRMAKRLPPRSPARSNVRDSCVGYNPTHCYAPIQMAEMMAVSKWKLPVADRAERHAAIVSDRSNQSYSSARRQAMGRLDSVRRRLAPSTKLLDGNKFFEKPWDGGIILPRTRHNDMLVFAVTSHRAPDLCRLAALRCRLARRVHQKDEKRFYSSRPRLIRGLSGLG